MENLDPLRQKPDFEEYANEHAGTHSASTQIAVGIKQGCEHVWTSHVEPLIAKLDGFDSFLDTLNDQAKKEYAALQSRIRELEEENKVLGERVQTWSKLADEKSNEAQKHFEDRDKFAIGFGNWIANEAVLGDSSYHKHAFGYGELKTMPELLELYKESLLNQKP